MPLTEAQIAYEEEPIPYMPIKRLERGPLYVRKLKVPHPIKGYSEAHDEYSVIDLRGYRKGYEPRLEILGIYTPNPNDLFRVQTGHLPPYQPTTTGDKLQAEMERLGSFQAWRILPEITSPSTHPLVLEQTQKSEFWDLTKTDMPLYDQMIKNPDYFRKAKGLESEIIYMTPNAFMMKCAKIQNSTLEAQYRELGQAFVNTYRDRMLAGVKFPIPVLDYAAELQEGRNRAIAAERAGATTIPVLVVSRVGQVLPDIHPLVLEQYPLGEVPEKIPIDPDIPIPPVRGAPLPPKKPVVKIEVPRVLTMEEYERDWKPQGWKLIIIGPTSTWRQEWGELEAIRDIVQNALDEAEAYRWGYDVQGLWISDRGRGVAVADFLLGPPKLKPDYARGKFGEGMKIAALALIRKGWPVYVETVGRELWIIFLEQAVDGTAETLAALWRPNGRTEGTTFHIVGYTGSAFEDRFAVNLPKSSILWEGPSTIKQPKQRFNQLIDYAFPTGSRIFTRDIYFRDINSPYSYNLWSFDMAPDRHAPAKEDDVWVDMGRLWCTVTKVNLLEIFLQMVKDPPILEAEESYKVNMDSWAMGEVAPGKYYAELIKDKQEGWQIAWRNVMGENAVLRTDEKWDNVVKHLGYQSVSISWHVRDALSRAIPTDRAIKDASQERLRETEVVPDEKLDFRQLTHLKLCRAIAKEVFPYSPVSGVYAAIIPPASDRVRTAGMYGTTTQAVYIGLDQLFRGRTTLDTLVHETAHHREFRQTGVAEDLSPAHAEAMTYIAAKVVEEVTKGTLDRELKEVSW